MKSILVAVVALCFASAYCYDYTYASYAYLGAPFSGATNGQTNNQFVFDVDAGLRYSSLSVGIGQLSYNGTDDPNILVFLRREASFEPGKDGAHWIKQCEQSQEYPNSLNPYECHYESFKADDGPYKPTNLTISVPRVGRYFLLVVGEDDFEDDAELTFSFAVQDVACSANNGGENCDTAVKDISFDGTNSEQQTGNVAANQWAYFMFSIKPNVANVQFEPDNIKKGDDSGVYFRFGNTPTYCNVSAASGVDTADGIVYTNLPCKTDWVEQSPFTTNWIDPVSGNYYIGVYGGESGLDYSFRINLPDICATGTNGAFCSGNRILNTCASQNIRTCASTDLELSSESFGVPQTTQLPDSRWSYFHFSLDQNYYRLRLTAKQNNYKDQEVAMVFNVGGYPENNQEATKIFNIPDVYVISENLDDEDEHTLDLYYATEAAGIYYIGFIWDGSNDQNMTITWSLNVTECPDDCYGNGECDVETSQCICDDSASDQINCNPQETSATIGNPSSSSTESPGLSTGVIVTLGICIPLAIVTVIFIIGGGLYYVKYHQNQYEAIA